MKLPAMLSLRGFPAQEIGLAALCEEPYVKPKPRESRLATGGLASSPDRLPLVTLFDRMAPACWRAEVRLEAWFRGEEEE